MKIVAPVVAALYSVGFALSASYYSSLGVHALTLAQPSYVLTGLWFVLPLVASLGYRKAYRALKIRGPVKALILLAFATLFSACCLVVLISVSARGTQFGSGSIPGYQLLPLVYLAFMVALSTFATALFGVACAGLTAATAGPKALFALLVGTIYLNAFMAGVMPRIPRSLGGGAISSVRLVMKRGEDGALKPDVLLGGSSERFDLGREVDRDSFPKGPLSRKYGLIFENDSAVFLSVGLPIGPDNHAEPNTLQLPKSSIDGLLYLPIEPDGSYERE